MIPINQQDYIRYSNTFKGNYIKGREIFKSLLESNLTSEELVNSPAASAAVFTNADTPINQKLILYSQVLWSQAQNTLLK